MKIVSSKREIVRRGFAQKVRRKQFGSAVFSEIEFHCELNQPRVVAGGGDTSEVARVAHDLTCVCINGAGRDGVEVADRVSEVDAIE
jgi:hypothetical protein